MFIISVIIAGVLLSISNSGFKGIYLFVNRLMGNKSEALIDNTVKTVRSVMNGVLGTAVIQTLAIAIGLFVFSVPAAPIIAIAVLIFAIAQLPVIILIIPVAIIMFPVLETWQFVIFIVWMLVGGLLDNILKPILLGRGVQIPMMIILVGAIGGMLAMGVIGLFIGAIILAVTFQILDIWLGLDEAK